MNAAPNELGSTNERSAALKSVCSASSESNTHTLFNVTLSLTSLSRQMTPPPATAVRQKTVPASTGLTPHLSCLRSAGGGVVATAAVASNHLFRCFACCAR